MTNSSNTDITAALLSRKKYNDSVRDKLRTVDTRLSHNIAH